MNLNRMLPFALVGAVLLGGLAFAQYKPEVPGIPSDPRDPRDPREPNGEGLRLPAGLYSAIVVTGSSSGGLVRVKAAGQSLRIHVNANDTVVVPFSPPWQLGQEGTIECNGGAYAWAITTSGPLSLSKN